MSFQHNSISSLTHWEVKVGFPVGLVVDVWDLELVADVLEDLEGLLDDPGLLLPPLLLAHRVVELDGDLVDGRHRPGEDQVRQDVHLASCVDTSGFVVSVSYQGTF